MTEREELEDLNVNGRIILNGSQSKRIVNDSCGSGHGKVRGFYGGGGILSAYIICWEFLTGFSRMILPDEGRRFR